MKELIERDAALALQPYDCDGDPCGKWDEPVFLKRADLFALPAIAPAQIRADALREAAGAVRTLHRLPMSGLYGAAGVLAYGPLDDTAEAAILALIDPPALSANPVDDKIGADPVANAALVEAADYILDGMGISYPDYAIDPEDDFLDAANQKWVRDTLERLAAPMRAIAEGQQ